MHKKDNMYIDTFNPTGGSSGQGELHFPNFSSQFVWHHIEPNLRRFRFPLAGSHQAGQVGLDESAEVSLKTISHLK